MKMNKNAVKLLRGSVFTQLSLLFLTGSPLIAQILPAQLLNDTRSFEVSACMPGKEKIISVWMEKRPERKDNDENAADMRVAYKSSANNGKDWTDKGIIDLTNTFATGNPYVTSNDKGESYLVCMHIGKDFWSGNISLYEFDFRSKQFILKSIPFKSDSQLLDKPSIVANGNEIHLVYNAYNSNFTNSVRYQMSRDKGKTWTAPVSVFHDAKIKYLGPSIALLKGNQIAVSSGAYSGNNIYLARKKTNADSTVFERPIVVSKISAKLGSAMTELSRFGEKLMLTWQNPHQRNETWLSLSNSDGNSWSAPFLITAKGNLLSAVVDQKGNIHCIFSDFSDQQFVVRYKVLNSRYEILKEDVLMQNTLLSTFTEYLGAYQKLLIRDNELYAFWIDYPNNNSLNFTKWTF